MNTYEQVAAKIRGEMAVQGKTVAELAEALDVSRQAASAKRNAYTTTNITVTELGKIADWLGLDPADFFTK